MRTARIKEGYGTIQRDIMCMKGISVYAKAVYALFVSYAGQKESCYPALRTVCNNLSLSKPTIIKAIKELEGVKLLEVERTIGESSIYYPNYLLKSVNQVTEEPQFTGKETIQFFFEGVYIGFDNHEDENGKEHIGFWILYDKKVDKKKTTKSWPKISPKIRAYIMSRIPLYKAYQPDRQYRKSPYSYLLNECWEDEDLHKVVKTPENQNSKTEKQLSTTW